MNKYQSFINDLLDAEADIKKDIAKRETQIIKLSKKFKFDEASQKDINQLYALKMASNQLRTIHSKLRNILLKHQDLL